MVPFFVPMRHIIFGVPVDDLSLDDLKQQIRTWLLDGRGNTIVTPNPEFLLLAQKQAAFKELLTDASLSVADGVGLRFAISALTEQKLQYRHTGIDLVQVICELAQEQRSKVLLLGGSFGMAQRARNVLSSSFSSLDLVAIDPGFVEGDATGVSISNDLLTQIRETRPDVLVVALGQGKQERFIKQIFDLNPEIRIAIGVGGSFETIAGAKPRASLALRKSGFEWLWRLFLEPSRWYRIFQASFVFPAVVISATLRQHRFLKAVKHTLPELWNQLTHKS